MNGDGNGGDDMADGEGGRGTDGSVGVVDDVGDGGEEDVEAGGEEDVEAGGEEDVEAERALAADLVVGAGPITCSNK